MCTEKSGCGGCASKKLIKELKQLVKRSDDDLDRHYKVIASGCLGHCSKGIVAVAFPENRIFTKLTKKSAPYILADLEELRKLRRIFDGSSPQLLEPFTANHSLSN